MRKLIVLALLISLVSSCTGFKENEKPAIKIGKIRISSERFQREFELSGFAKEGKKKDFLKTFISRKLILLEAEKLGLDKDPEFLHDVQGFWEQSLLKLVLAKKIKELVADVNINEEEIRSYYMKNKDKEFIDKEFDQAYDQIKVMLLRGKQQNAIEDWVDSLEDDAEVVIDYKLLGIESN